MTGYEKLDDRQLLNELGRKLVQITYAKKVNNSFMADMYERNRNDILRECDSRGLLTEAKELEICG